MNKTCLLVATISSNLKKLPSEVQELANVLSSAGNKIIILQSPVTRLEIYRALSNGRIDIVWFGAHSSEEGWVLDGGEEIKASEFAWFIKLCGATDVILNSCYSVRFVETLRDTANVVATISDRGVDDGEAWSTALYFGRALVVNEDVQSAYDNVISGIGTQYQFFASRKKVMTMSAAKQQTDESVNVRELSRSVEQLTRALQGDSFANTPGLIKMMERSQSMMEESQRMIEQTQAQLNKYIETEKELHQHVIKRVDTIEQIVVTGRYLTISLPQALVTIAIIVIFTLLVFYGVSMLQR